MTKIAMTKFSIQTEGVTQSSGTAGEAYSKGGYLLYADANDDSKLKKADTSDVAKDNIIGMNVAEAALDDTMYYIPLPGLSNLLIDVEVGNVVNLGEAMYAVDSGEIGQWSDLSSGDKIVQVGAVWTGTILSIFFKDTGKTKA